MNGLPDTKWIDLIKDTDFQFVMTIACGLFLLVHWLAGWPPNMPWWVIPVAWFFFLLCAVWLALKILGHWLDSRSP